jgi:hypothetical protein
LFPDLQVELDETAVAPARAGSPGHG